MGKSGSWLVLVACLAACGPEELSTPGGNNVCDSPSVRAALPDLLAESSGVAASRTHRGVFWTHNDSGDQAAVFAFDSTGTVRARVRIESATNRDWEDMAIGPCEPGSIRDCLFIGELGDNNERHPHVAVYRVPEPDPATDTVTEPADIFRFTYPDGPRDAESVFVTDAGIHVVNKGRSDAIELFRLRAPYRAGTVAQLDRVQQLAPPPTSVSAQVTAAAADEAGERVVVRSYSGLRFFTVQDDTLRPRGRAADIVAPQQMQGEAVDFLNGDRLLLTGEAQGPYPASVVIVTCDPSRPPPDTTQNPSD